MNEIDANINNMSNSEVTCPDITYPAIMVECEDKNKIIKLIIEQKPAWTHWIR